VEQAGNPAYFVLHAPRAMRELHDRLASAMYPNRDVSAITAGTPEAQVE
jgi:hypothetical protein